MLSSKKNITIIKLFLVFFLLVSLIGNKSSASISISISFDFEENLDGWVPYKTTYNTEFVIDHQVQEGFTSSKSAKLIGTSNYGLNFSARNLTIELTNSSTIDFAWLFENDHGAYTGLKLHSSGFGSLYIYSYFYGIFANTSYAGILEIYGERPMKWYNHTVDLYEAYMQIFGALPETIDYLYLLNYPIGGGSNFCDQTTYFDNITFNEVVRENEETSFHLNFEGDLEGWEAIKQTSNSEFFIDVVELESFDRKVAKLVGTSQYSYNFSEQQMQFGFVESSSISFQWKFDNRVGAYSGIRLHTSNFGSLYIYAYFFGLFANTSTTGILEIYGQGTGVWYNHSVDLYEAYMQIFGEIPDTIDYIALTNYPIGGGESPSEQISYFDTIVLTGEISPLPSTTATSSSLVVILPMIICLVYLEKRRNRRM